MIYYHDLKEPTIDLTDAIKNHSGDETFAYKQVEGKNINMALYFPKDYNPNNKYPVFVFVHGGGWAGRQIFADQTDWSGDHLGFLARYYANKGFVSVGIDYRMMQEDGQKDGYELIDLYEDCDDAVKYLVANKEKWGLDFDRSVVLGESAGGYLAGALANLSYRGKTVFKKAILVNAILDMFDSHWTCRLKFDSNRAELKGKSKPEIAQFMSVVHNISGDTPKTLLLHGIEDSVVRPYHSHYYHDEMDLHGNKADLHYIYKTNHAFLLAEYMLEKDDSLSAANVAIEIINEWLNV